MTIRHHTMVGPLLAGTLGVAFWGGLSSAQVPSAPGAQEMHREIVVTAPRNSDEALTAKVTEALQNDAYILADHVTVSTEGGVVHVRGVVSDLEDLFRILRLAGRIAGRGRVVNDTEFVPFGYEGD